MMFNKKVNLGIYFAVLLILSQINFEAISQTKTFDLQNAIDYSLKNNRDIKIAVLEVDRAQAAVGEAYGYALPTVDFSASLSHYIEKMKMPFPDFRAMLTNATNDFLYYGKYTYKKEDGSIGPMTEEEWNKNKLPMETILQSFALANNYQAQFQVSQILFNSAVFTGIGSAGTYLETSKTMLKSQVSKTILGVQKAFYNALLMKEMFGVIKSSFNTFEETVKNIKLLYDQGIVSEYDYLQMKVQLENLKPRVLETENAYKLTLDALKLAMSMDKSEQIEINGTYDVAKIDIPDLNSTIDEAMRKNLDIQSLEYKKKVDEAFVELNRSEYYPSLVAFGNYSFSGAADDFNFINYRQSMVGLSLSFNLFNGGKTNKKVEQQLVNVLKTDEQIKTLKDAIALGIKSKLLDLQRIKENINSTLENVNLSERAYRIAELRLKEGTGTQLELINAEQAKRESILNKYKAINDYYNAKFELDNYLGIIPNEYLINYKKELEN